MVLYRTFRNDDTPGLMDVWNRTFTGRSAVALSTHSLLENHVFSKPYFDPAGLILAVDEGRTVGFVHAGFGPDEKETALSLTEGVVAMIAVAPSHQRRGIGSELLRRAQDYLRQRGARTLFAGAVAGTNPFYFGLYGGSDATGFLDSDAAAPTFLARHGYQPCRTALVWQRRLGRGPNVVDARFAALRRRFEIVVGPRKGTAGWWRECVLGLLEPIDFRLQEKVSSQSLGRAIVWEMEAFGRTWQESAVGLLGVEVRPEARRQGLARFLLAQMLRYLQDQYFGLVEVQCTEQDEPAARLFRGLGFEQVDTSRTYRHQQG